MNGHGTHVAGIVASRKFGVAKKAQIYSIKCLDRFGNGKSSSIIAAIQNVTANAVPGKAIINLSVVSPVYSKVLDAAITAAYKVGIPVFVGVADNPTSNCVGSPMNAKGAFAVGAADRNDNVAPYSDRGACIQAYAPGDKITSVSFVKTVKSLVKSGTSQAVPHVAGVAALLLSRVASTPNAIYQTIRVLALRNVLGGITTPTYYLNIAHLMQS